MNLQHTPRIYCLNPKVGFSFMHSLAMPRDSDPELWASYAEMAATSSTEVYAMLGSPRAFAITIDF